MKLIFKTLQKFIVPFVMVSTLNSGHTASFDCSKATMTAEIKVCSTPSLSSLDDEMFSLYTTAKSKSADLQTLKQSQIKWITEMRSCETNEQCMTNAYKQRIEELTALTLKQEPTRTQNENVQVAKSNPSEIKTIEQPAAKDSGPATSTPPTTSEKDSNHSTNLPTTATTAPQDTSITASSKETPKTTSVNEAPNQTSNNGGGLSGVTLWIYWAVLLAVFFGSIILCQINENKNNILTKIYTPIWNFVKSHSTKMIEPEFELVRGEVIQVGGYQKNYSLETTIVESNHKYIPTTATTRETNVRETVSNLQIGTRFFQGIEVPTKAVWEGITVGDNVCCVVGESSQGMPQLFCVHSFTQGISFGSSPDPDLSIPKWVCAVLSFVSLHIFFSNMVLLNFLALLITAPIFLALFFMYRTFAYTEKQTNGNWDIALLNCEKIAE